MQYCRSVSDSLTNSGRKMNNCCALNSLLVYLSASDPPPAPLHPPVTISLVSPASLHTLLILCQLPVLSFTSPNLLALLQHPVPLGLFLLAYTSASLQCPGVSALLSLTTKMQFPLFIALSHLSSCSTDSSAQESYKSFTGCSDKK